MRSVHTTTMKTLRNANVTSYGAGRQTPSWVISAFLFIAINVVFGSIIPSFATEENVINILRQASSLFMLACGQTLVILLGDIDLSQGSVVGLVSAVTAFAILRFGIVAGIVLGLILGATIGLALGALVVRARVQAFIVSLGAQFVLSGIGFIITRGGYPVYGLPSSFAVIGQSSIGVIPVPVILMAAIAIILYLLLERTTVGRSIYAVGGNAEAARLSGIDVGRTRFLAWIVNGVLVASGSIILSSRVVSGQPWLGGLPLLMESMAAAVIGGTSLSGGRGSIPGTLAGVLLISFLVNGLTLIGVDQFIREIVLGLAITIAVWVGFGRK